MCGENSSGLHALALGVGSPPRVRGKPLVDTGSMIAARITPACAGKTIEIRVYAEAV